ncbi:hypothetical protein ACIBL5_35025 [Streptomyces sp. NPDC050516]|uniref:hypothetical protein n=1 Tax=Streptomyces sp. NPDC050516 TaxID=3365621 RepID=UPI0037B7DD05
MLGRETATTLHLATSHLRSRSSRRDHDHSAQGRPRGTWLEWATDTDITKSTAEEITPAEQEVAKDMER